MSWLSFLLLAFIVLNVVQNVILAYLLRDIASGMGKRANYITRMTSDQIFLYRKVKNDKGTISVKNIKLLYYSIFTSIFQVILVMSLFLSLVF